MSLLLVCVRLIILMMCCNKRLVKQALRLRIARPMCDGRPFASSPFRRLASRGFFFSAAFFFFAQEYWTIPRSQQVRQRKERAFEGIEEHVHAVDRRTGWRFFKPGRRNLSPSSSSTNCERNNWATRSSNSWYSSRSDHSWKFSQIRTSFVWPGGKLPDNRPGM